MFYHEDHRGHKGTDCRCTEKKDVYLLSFNFRALHVLRGEVRYFQLRMRRPQEAKTCFQLRMSHFLEEMRHPQLKMRRSQEEMERCQLGVRQGEWGMENFELAIGRF